MSEGWLKVRRRRWARGGRIASVLALCSLALTGCSTAQWERNLRFGWPTGVTKQGEKARVLWTWTGVTALALGIVVWGLIFWCCVRYKKRSDELPRQTKYNFAVEMVCFTFPFIILAGLFYRTVIVEDDENHLSKNPDVLVQVDAFKWNWEFEYKQYRVDGAKQPTTELQTGSPTGANAQYLNTVGNSTLIPVLVIPVNRTVQFIEHSEDVIHSFWVPEFLFKRDVIPYDTGNDNDNTHDNRFQITATKTGSYVGRCAELCGIYHSQMNFEVRVVPVNTFNRYLAALKSINPDNTNIQALALKKAGMTPYATTTYPFDTSRQDTAPSQRGQQEDN